MRRFAKVLWSPSYFAASVGYVSESTVRRYIEHQWDAVASLDAPTCFGCARPPASIWRCRRVWKRTASCTTRRCRNVEMRGRTVRPASTTGISRRSWPRSGRCAREKCGHAAPENRVTQAAFECQRCLHRVISMVRVSPELRLVGHGLFFDTGVLSPWCEVWMFPWLWWPRRIGPTEIAVHDENRVVRGLEG